MAEKYSKLAQKYIDILKTGKISENELQAMKSFINSDKPTSDERDKLLDMISDGIELDKAQQKKGIDWLIKQYKTPNGKIKNSHPFGSREIYVLENWDEAYLSGLENLNMFNRNFQPVYAVKTKEGDRFEYTLSGGKIKIIG